MLIWGNWSLEHTLFFFLIENRLNCNSQEFQKVHFILPWNSKSIMLTRLKVNITYSWSVVTYTVQIWLKDHLSWTKTKDVRFTFAWLQAFKRSNISILQRIQCPKIKKTSLWFWGGGYSIQFTLPPHDHYTPRKQWKHFFTFE